MRPDRLFLLGLVATLAALSIGRLCAQGQRIQAAERASNVLGGPTQASAKLELFRGELRRLREGDESALPGLREHANHLCVSWNRCDTLDVVEYYAALSSAARRRGLADEALFLQLRQATVDAAPDGERERELREFLGRVPPDGDRVPAAQALSLCAGFATERLERDRTITKEVADALALQAHSDLRESQLLFARAGMLRPRLELLWIQGRLQARERRLGEAHSSFEECLGMARRVYDTDYQERALTSLLGLAEMTSDLPAIESNLHELAVLQAPHLSWPVVTKQAAWLLWKDEPGAAVDFLGAHPPTGGAELSAYHLWIGAALTRQGDLNGAASEIEAGASPGTESEVERARAFLSLKRGRPAEALERLGHIDLARLRPRARAECAELIGEALLNLGRSADAARVLEVSLQQGASAEREFALELVDSTTANLLGELIGLHTLCLYARAKLELGDALSAAVAIEEYQSRTLRPRSAALTREALVAWAKSTEFGLLTWVVGPDQSVVVHVGPDGRALGATIPRGRRVLFEAVRRVRESLLAGNAKDRDRLAREVLEAFVPASIAQALRGAGAGPGRLLLCVHGPLEELPFELSEVLSFFPEACVTFVLPGLTASEPGAAWDPRSARTWNLLGDPLDQNGQHLLPAARDELSSIAELYARAQRTTHSDTGRRFDSQALSAALASGDPLHLATHVRHGCGAQGARLSDAGFELSGGESVCASEILANAPALPLAVLAACETGEGKFADAQGLQGLARTFLESGTRNLIVTSWPVSDRWAREFALAFHRALLAGALPAQAAARARAGLRTQGAPAADWAAFRLLGRD